MSGLSQQQSQSITSSLPRQISGGELQNSLATNNVFVQSIVLTSLTSYQGTSVTETMAPSSQLTAPVNTSKTTLKRTAEHSMPGQQSVRQTVQPTLRTTMTHEVTVKPETFPHSTIPPTKGSTHSVIIIPISPVVVPTSATTPKQSQSIIPGISFGGSIGVIVAGGVVIIAGCCLIGRCALKRTHQGSGGQRAPNRADGGVGFPGGGGGGFPNQQGGQRAPDQAGGGGGFTGGGGGGFQNQQDGQTTRNRRGGGRGARDHQQQDYTPPGGRRQGNQDASALQMNDGWL